MESEKIFSVKNLKTAIIIAIIVAILSLAVSLWQTPKYEASVKMLVVFNQSNIDPYTASRTADYISNVLGEVIYSNSFVDQIFKSNFALKDELGTGQETRAKNWQKMVRVKIKENKGVMTVSVFNPDRDQANKFAEAITYTLITKHQLYHGFGDKVVLKIIDNPTASNQIAEPKILNNTGIGFLAGLVIGLTLIVIFPEQKLFEFFSFRLRQAATRDEMISLFNQENSSAPANQNTEPQYSLPTGQTGLPPKITAENQPAEPNQNANKNQYYNW